MVDVADLAEAAVIKATVTRADNMVDGEEGYLVGWWCFEVFRKKLQLHTQS